MTGLTIVWVVVAAAITLFNVVVWRSAPELMSTRAKLIAVTLLTLGEAAVGVGATLDYLNGGWE